MRLECGAAHRHSRGQARWLLAAHRQARAKKRTGRRYREDGGKVGRVGVGWQGRDLDELHWFGPVFREIRDGGDVRGGGCIWLTLVFSAARVKSGTSVSERPEPLGACRPGRTRWQAWRSGELCADEASLAAVDVLSNGTAAPRRRRLLSLVIRRARGRARRDDVSYSADAARR